MRVAVIDYGSGNLRSAQKSLERAAHEGDTGQEIIITNNPDDLKDADRVVLPGVGAFGDCARGLKAVSGMWEALHEHAVRRGRPFLGICVGMQLMAEEGLEHGHTAGFGWMKGAVSAIPRPCESLRIPHMGWNTVRLTHQSHPLFAGIETGDQGLHAYFVHSYQLVPENDRDILATTGYGSTITAAVARDNLAGTQFHPEKSQWLGLKFLQNFLKWSP